MSGDTPLRIGVLGGTFDPIHVGHLRPALEVQQQLQLDQVLLVPCHRTSHREQPQRSSVLRSQMAQLAVADLPGFSVDERELQRESLSYTADTLAELREAHPRAELFFLLGSDSFDYFQQWHRWQEILEHATLVIMTRPGTQWCAEAKTLLTTRADRIIVAETTELRISSTGLRAMLRAGQDPRYLLPEPVREFILQEQLYTD